MIQNFYWIIEGQLAGMAMPTAARAYAYLEDADRMARKEFLEEIRVLQNRGIQTIITLTESPLASTPIKQAGMDYLHIPIPDMTAPTPSQIQQFVGFVHQSLHQKKPVVVHCLGGCGRTGTLLACYLVSLGKTSGEAIRNIRAANPNAIETLQQEEAVIDYAASCHHPSNS